MQPSEPTPSPGHAATPANPTGPANPANPATPTGAADRAGPANPANPTGPADPTGPTGPTGPAGAIDRANPSAARLALLLLFLAYTLNFADRTIIAAIGQAIKDDLRISDLQLGLLGGLYFALLYTFLGLPAARLAERFSRVNIIAAATVVWRPRSSPGL